MSTISHGVMKYSGPDKAIFGEKKAKIQNSAIKVLNIRISTNFCLYRKR